MRKETIVENLNRVRERIVTTCAACGRDPGAVSLLAVSKTRPAEDLRAAYVAGQRHFGENYLQEAQEKRQQLADLDICWHFIGPLQSNKTRAVAEGFHWLHTVDRLKIARRLSAQRPPEMPPLNICLQVNVDAEESKSGVSVQALPALAAAVAELPNLRLRGLMAIPAPRESAARQREPFAQLAELLRQLRNQLPGQPLDTLSMGMSGDMEAAIACGATIVRIGTDIFGARN
ncbi:YggS family pyridoxal phosphate-dependent enzyme [Microbulbifer thermotolerans]|uniref:YggS family pyridoxal phosphate-dependent enzyme n=1 Tax=Microbulbifer thermotolerans TaxID=252514 RepID=UPI002248CAC8|nr:YggS family pyridoxal phosphate-dependent enzyme [Microbulbifer thermotolerans]MCX2779086.1 YggS family pyridoxal phosphate-dependent enzyme [Microbulbifer thermotolerans]MCX2782728.1 YggS family pyridoxal phosphate-dependent enzyme [Microbulbifer thermotolerans]MCX2795618.1 YggS family pyridoxal phosphate-dependent enzyme [Microbulbifer thermotolerans]MCX2805282.1 YggS family pyridoxal phosphate-dependent enzyme [Microbulbifer thermotolerans]MCX2831797.1 YggS family pyridoxal phosphate-dep